MADTRLPLDVYDDKADAERAAEETWGPMAARQGYDVEVHPTTHRAVRIRGTGQYRQAGPYGVYLRERKGHGRGQDERQAPG